MFRTTDSGRTWTDVFPGGRIASVSCTSRRVCYAGTDRTPSTPSGSDWNDTIYRSKDAGGTWTQ